MALVFVSMDLYAGAIQLSISNVAAEDRVVLVEGWQLFHFDCSMY